VPSLQRWAPLTAHALAEHPKYRWDLHWEPLFRFTREQFFTELLPALKLPAEDFKVHGYAIFLPSALVFLNRLALLSLS
jgi:hypothetical protein